MVNSRDKGARGERDARDAVREYWHAHKCIRAGQANGSYSADLLDALPNAHVEVKRIKRIPATDFVKQAQRDRQPTEFPVVLMREDEGEWLVVFPLKDSDAFVNAYLANFSARK